MIFLNFFWEEGGLFPSQILNDLQRTRLSRRGMIWLLPNPLPPSSFSKLDWRLTGKQRKRHNLLTGWGGGRGGEGVKLYDVEKA
jgi:hypothetical protein